MAKKAPKAKVYKFASLDHADTSSMSFEELQNYCLQLFQQIDLEKKDCEKYQLEREKLLRYWNYSGDSLRKNLYDLRDQELCLENDEYSMKTRMDRKVQEVTAVRLDASKTIEDAFVKRCAILAKKHEVITEKGHQVWSDVQTLKSKLVNAENVRLESLTNRTYIKQNYLELIGKNMLKQRKFDLVRLNKELRKERKKYVFDNSEKFRKEITLKKDVMKAAIKNNTCSLKKLISSFERILSYNFEKVSNLKDKAESLKKLDIMLSKEYSEASKAFYRLVSAQAEGMRTLNQMRTFLYASGKTERSLANKKNELSSNRVQSEAHSIKQLNSELRTKQLESRLADLTETVISYRKVMTKMFREDADILSRNIDKSLLELYQQKVHLYSLISPDKEIDFKWETADFGDLTYRTENLRSIQQFLTDFHAACSAVIALYNRLFKLWKVSYDDLGIVLNESKVKALPNYKNKCKTIKYFNKW